MNVKIELDVTPYVWNHIMEKETISPWPFIESYLSIDHLKKLVRHQIESYNDFIQDQIPKTIEMFNPIIAKSEHDRIPGTDIYTNEVIMHLGNFSMHRPQIHENNGATKIMTPHDARLRGFTYASTTTIDLDIKVIVRDPTDPTKTQTFQKRLESVQIGKLPVMLRSAVCVLPKSTGGGRYNAGECGQDAGGYFIINGSEKIVIAQERAAENITYAYKSKATKWEAEAHIKSVPADKCISPKQISIYIAYAKKQVTATPQGVSAMSEDGRVMHVQLPRLKTTLPLFVLFRALGIISDRDICETILLDIESSHRRPMLRILRSCVVEASAILTQEDAIEYAESRIHFTPMNVDKAKGDAMKRNYIMQALTTDMYPHCNTPREKVLHLGCMVRHLLECHLNYRSYDDRDAYKNKRLDTVGVLLNNLFRNYMNKMVKDMVKAVRREINSGSWKSQLNYGEIVTTTNVYKIVKASTIENGIRRALSTGDFALKGSQSTKVGVAQVLNRLTYQAALSHSRRVNTPIDKSGKLIPPRKLHGSSWGFICPAETPEGGSVGVVKNLSYMAHITVGSSVLPLHNHVNPHIITVSEATNEELASLVKVFINGAWVGCTRNPLLCYSDLKTKKLSGAINVYASITWDVSYGEIRLCGEAGRVTRPVFRVVDGKLVATVYDSENLSNGSKTWDDMMFDPVEGNAAIEYIDAAEQEHALIAMWPKDLIPGSKYTHCEIHPSTIFGVIASCIPYPDHNQSPRNTYQCAMGKQAMGVYVTNYKERMDKTGYILTYPMRPLVDTRVMNMLQLNNIPSGEVLIVAIGVYGGFNQEDSIMFNQAFVERGGAAATIYKTEKDEDKKASGEEEVRCAADPARTRGMKFANYGKLNTDGIVPENTPVVNKDVIIGKVIPIRDARTDHHQTIKYQDHSKVLRSREQCHIDRNVVATNADGYSFCKVRTRAWRKPETGDKFSSRHGQKGTIGLIIPEEDMPFTADGVRPDIIINPHAIPSRMTIGQLKETLLGKVLLEIGIFGDGTSFSSMTLGDIRSQLTRLGLESTGNEVLMNGMTGEQLEASIFIGPVFYQRLKHMVRDKVHSRGSGPMVTLTHQPAEGRAREGGLRFGEMERDCMISHGASRFTKERVYDVSDKYHVYVCKDCGMIAAYNDEAGIHCCRACDNRTKFSRVELPYACKLLFQELTTMNVVPRIIAP